MPIKYYMLILLFICSSIQSMILYCKSLPELRRTKTEQETRDQIKKFLEDGTDPNRPEDETGNTAIHYAAKNMRLDVVNLLLEYQADINAQNMEGLTPFMCLI